MSPAGASTPLSGGIALRDIGRGSCGSVFEIPGTALAIKKGANAAAIWNDYNLTNRAYKSYMTWAVPLSNSFPGPCAPRVAPASCFNGPDSHDFWNNHLQQFPPGDRTRAAAFHIDHILPVPSHTRQALIRRFYKNDEITQREVFDNPKNRDCLVRLYFGKASPPDQLYDSSDTLRNFPLYLDQARKIGLDIQSYSEEMAIGLAILHWDAQIDAADTEFIIGRSKGSTFPTIYPDHELQSPPVCTNDDFSQIETQMWMLDYDKCSRVNLDSNNGASDVVNKYLVAVTGNDPYFPHPCGDVDLWQQFKAAYLKTSQQIISVRNLGDTVAKYPEMLMEQWEHWGREDAETNEADPFERGSGDEEGVGENAGWGDEDIEEDATDSDEESDNGTDSGAGDNESGM